MPLPDIFKLIEKTAEWFSKPDNRGLDTFDRVFLRMGQLAEDVGVSDDRLKIYNRVVGRGDTSPITENDLSKDTLSFLSSMVRSKDRDGGGSVSYPDYKKYGIKRDVGFNEIHQSLPSTIGGMPLIKGYQGDSGAAKLLQTLGQFSYKADGKGGFLVSDNYDFNPRDKSKHPGISPVEKPVTMLTDPLYYARELGGRVVPPGKGAPVRVKIPRKP